MNMPRLPDPNTDQDGESLHPIATAYVVRAQQMMARAERLVRDDRIDAIELLAARREALAQHFQRYQALKHKRIFDPVILHGRASSKVIAREMKVDCVQLGLRFGAYYNRWIGLRADDWTSYREDMLQTMTAIRLNLNHELRAIQQLLLLHNFYR